MAGRLLMDLRATLTPGCGSASPAIEGVQMSREITELQRAWLVKELDAWHDQGLVDDAQRQVLLGLYATPEDLGRQRQSQALGILSTLAALMVGLGVMLLIAYNWDAMAASAKVAVILIGLVTVHSVGLHLRFRQGRAIGGEVAFFLGCLLYGAGIWLIAQIFHLSASDGAAWWWWAAGVLPFALACDSLALHALYCAILAAWVGVEILGYANLGAWLFGRWPGVPNGAYGLLAMVVPGVVWAYRKGSPRALALYLPVVAWWVVLQPFAWRLEDFPIYFIGAVGGLLLLAAELHKDRSAMGIPYRFYGALLTAGALIPLSYHEFNKHLGRWQPLGRAGPDFTSLVTQPLSIVVLAAGVVALVIAGRRRFDPKAAPIPLIDELRELARRQWLPAGVILGMAGLAMWRLCTAGVEALVPTVAANAAMVVLALWLIQIGLRDDRGMPFTAGVLYFLLWTILRYIDLFGDFGGMPGAALMFFLCGGTLFGVAWFWQHRKGAKTETEMEVTHAAV
jgi:uncharacterized membrane protein